MVYRLFPILFGAATIVIVQSQITLAVSAEEISKIAEEITVLIQTPGSPGSGIILSKQGNTYSVLTARHVVDSINSGEEADITTSDGQVYLINTNKMQKFPNVDLAIIEFEANKNYQVAKLGNSQETKAGKIVYVAGFPLPTAAITTSLFNFTEGKVTANANRPLADGYGIVYSNNTLPGMSGGPLLNENGELIGVHGRADTEETKATDNPEIRVKTNFNLAVPINTYLSLTGQIAATTPTTAALTADDYFLQGVDKYNKKDVRGAIADLDLAVKTDGNFVPGYLTRGALRDELGNKQGAKEDFDRAIQIDPNFPLAYIGRGNSRNSLGDNRGAIEDFDRAIQLDPNNADAYIGRGIGRDNLGDKQGAIQDFDRAIQFDPNNALAYYNRAITRSALGDKPGAVKDYDRAIQLDPNLAMAYNNRANARSALGDKQGALQDHNRAIQLNPNSAIFYHNRGSVRNDLGDNQGAMEDFDRAIGLDPNYTLSYYGRGFIYHQQGNYPAAIDQYNKVLSLNRNFALAIINIGLIKYEMGSIEKAIQQFQQAIQIDNLSAQPQLALAVALYNRGQTEQALQVAQSALKLDKSFANVEVLQENLWGTRILSDAQKLLAQLGR